MAATGLAALLLAGCTLPDGIDGDLTGGWAALPDPVGFVPEAGTCHPDSYQASSRLTDYQPVDCAEPHLSETVHVGEFTGEAADRVTPPPPGSGQWRAAYRDCDDAAAEFLGGNFRHARLWLGVSVPSPEGWEGGSRWYRCEVVVVDDRALLERTRSGSLAGALAGDSDLRLGCFEVTIDEESGRVEEMRSVDCDEPHHAQYVGLWDAPDVGYLDGANQEAANQVYRGCREQVAEYANVPIDADLPFRTGTIADWMDEEDWDNGDRSFRCYLWLNGDEIVGSLAGEGTSGLPVR